MDRRLERITRTGAELGADYVGDVLAASAKFMDSLLQNVATLTRGVIEEGSKVAAAACEVFLPEDAR